MLSNRSDTNTIEAPEGSQMSCKIYVGNLAWATDENALGSHFTSIGKVKEAVVMRTEGRSRGFGFVTFSTPDQAKQAIATMYDSELHGRRLRVNVANQQGRAGGTSSSDHPMGAAPGGPPGGPPGGYHYPPAVYPSGGHAYPGGPYGGYPHPPAPSQQGSYMGGGYVNSTNYTGHEPSGYEPPAAISGPIDNRRGNQPGGFYPNGAPYNYPPSGYGY